MDTASSLLAAAAVASLTAGSWPVAQAGPLLLGWPAAAHAVLCAVASTDSVFAAPMTEHALDVARSARQAGGSTAGVHAALLDGGSKLAAG